jgi:hypothetical protein
MRGLVVPTTVAVTGNDLEMTGADGRIVSEAVLARGRTMVAEILEIAELQRLRNAREAIAAD